MERLTKRETEPLSNGEECVICNYEKADCNNSCMYKWCKWSEKALKKLKDYEDKQEQGLLIFLPCKVGDTVYFILREEIIPVLVDGFSINENGLFICGTSEEHFGYSRLTPPAKNLYLTRSEAEEALAKMEVIREKL